METDFIKQTIHDILSRLGIGFEIEVVDDPEIKATRFVIKTEDSKLLIGYKGATLSALGHIIKRIVDNKFGDTRDRAYFLVDVNNYYGNKIEEIKTSARMLAERAKYFKSRVEMDPLPSYERMIVHSLFNSSEDFETESSGEGERRRVAIRYIGE